MGRIEEKAEKIGRCETVEILPPPSGLKAALLLLLLFFALGSAWFGVTLYTTLNTGGHVVFAMKVLHQPIRARYFVT